MPGRPLLLAVLAAALTLLLGRLVEPLDRRSFDARLALRRDAGWPKDLVWVPIDDAAIRSQGRWPWPRSLSARLLDRVHELGAKTVVFDASLVGKTTPEDDTAMARALAHSLVGVAWSVDAGSEVDPGSLRRALLPATPPEDWMAPRRRLSPPEPEFAAETLGMGHTMLQVKSDGYVRSHVPLLGVEGEKGSLPSLPLAGWIAHRDLKPEDVRHEDSTLFIKGSPPITLYRGEMYLDIVPGGARPPVARAEDILRGTDDAAARRLLEGKLALVYVDSILQPDALQSPLGAKTPGGELLSLAFRSFEHGAAPKPVPRAVTWIVVALATLLVSDRLSRRPPSFVLAAGAVLAIAVVVIGFALVPLTDHFMSVAAPAAHALLWGALLATHASRASEQERTRLRALLQGVPKLVPPLEERSTMAIGGRATKDAGTESLIGGGPLLQPVQIGRYMVQRPLGRGGMGAIFLAIDQDLARPVAMKILESQSKEAFERFRREALSVARIVHPNVVQIHEVGFDASVPYIVMEYVAGGTLSDLLRDPDEPLPMEWARASKIIRDVARGLGAAHRVGIVHRDVKPSNLLLTARRGSEAKVADFGIAKLIGGEALTREGMFIGTIGYLAPEQAVGKEVDARSDVYSLGITFYRLLTGQHAFEGSTAEMLKATVRQTVPDVRSLNPEVPAPLAELVVRMTSLQPDDRPADGNAVADALDAFLSEKRKIPG